MKIINLPSVLDDDGGILLINCLNDSIDVSEISIDFRPLQFVRPFGTLITAEAIKDFSAKRRMKGYKTYCQDPQWILSKGSGPISYLKYFGFFQYCGLNIGEKPNKDYHTNTYFPIQVIRKQDLEKQSFIADWRKGIERKCEDLSTLICNDPVANEYLDYSIREIIRNVFEHANISECSIMAQCYGDEIEFAIADRGVGIHSTLSEKYKTKTALDSVLLSLEPGVSRVDIDRSKGSWGNSGFGLYVLSGVGKTYGTFSLLSSGAYIKMYEDDQKTIVDKTYFTGTAVKLSVDRKQLEYFPNLRKKLIDEGEKLYEERHGKKMKASGKSKGS